MTLFSGTESFSKNCFEASKLVIISPLPCAKSTFVCICGSSSFPMDSPESKIKEATRHIEKSEIDHTLPVWREMQWCTSGSFLYAVITSGTREILLVSSPVLTLSLGKIGVNRRPLQYLNGLIGVAFLIAGEQEMIPRNSKSAPCSSAYFNTSNPPIECPIYTVLAPFLGYICLRGIWACLMGTFR